jgi:hypothetical protein
VIFLNNDRPAQGNTKVVSGRLLKKKPCDSRALIILDAD